MEQHVGLVVLEHLCHELDVHVADVDLLQVLVQDCDRFVELFLWSLFSHVMEVIEKSNKMSYFRARDLDLCMSLVVDGYHRVPRC